MPKNTPVKRAPFTVSISIALRDRLRILSKTCGIKTSSLVDEAVMDLLSKYASKGGIQLMNDDQRETKHIICLTNYKGGVGKTTTTAALAYLFASLGKKRVLLMDADGQFNLTIAMKAAMDGKRDILGAIMAKIADAGLSIGNFIMPTQYEGIDIIPGNRNIAEDIILQQINKFRAETGINPWEELVEDVRQARLYDIVLIDTHPSIHQDSLFPMQASDYLLAPLEPSNSSVAGFTQVYTKIMSTRRGKQKPRILGCFFNKVKKNTSSAKEYIPSVRKEIPQKILEATGQEMEGRIFHAEIRDSEDVRKSDNFQCAVTERFRNKNIASDYRKLYYEITEVLYHG